MALFSTIASWSIAASVALPSAASPPPLEPGQALLLGVIEGLTEFLPVSSTGHLILAEHVLGLHGEAVESYSVVIQLGALLAALVHYRRRFASTLLGILARQPPALQLLRNLILASLPLLVLGYLFGKHIKAQLFRPLPIALALAVGGGLMLLVELYQRRHPPTERDAENLPVRGALITGLLQALSLWPGTSRSMACIVGAQLAGLPRAAAADYAFLLALPTLGAATLYELLKHGSELSHSLGAGPVLLGLLTSFLTGWAVIAAFIRYLGRFGLWPFALYRIALGTALLWLLTP